MSGQLKDTVRRYLDNDGFHYDPCEGKEFIMTGITTDELTVRMVVIFDDNDRMLQIRTMDLAKVPQTKLAQALIAINAANKQYRWVSFYLDDDGEIIGQADAIVDIDTAGVEVRELLSRTARVASEAYPTFMRAIYA